VQHSPLVQGEAGQHRMEQKPTSSRLIGGQTAATRIMITQITTNAMQATE
jgi:hypothetical protein